MSDHYFIQQLKKNDDNAIEELITKYGQYAASVVYGVGGSSLHAEDIEEVVSDVFYAIWKSRHKILPVESLKPYLAQIARNMTKNNWKHATHDQPLDDELTMTNSLANRPIQRADFVAQQIKQSTKITSICTFPMLPS